MEITSTKALEKLAWTLAKNHFDTSVPDNLTYDKDPDCRASQLVFEGGLAAGPPQRTILVVGAGSSGGTFGRDEFPGTRAAIDQIDKKLQMGTEPMSAIRALVQARKLQLSQAYAYKDALTDFETHLALLSDIFSHETVSSHLADLYKKSFRPHLVFELIAHMLKHRFIDVVINFNFDELLDQAISGEMGSGEYHRIVSDGACGDLTRYLVGDRLKVPLYIKPHGTVSQPTTMRFTKDQYHRLPHPMRKLLGDVIAGHRFANVTGDGEGCPRYPVNLITIGFAMKSLDLNALIGAAATGGTEFTLFHIDQGSERDSFKKVADDQEWSFPRRFIAVEDIGTPGNLKTTMDDLWTKVHRHFRRSFRPRGVARHRIVHTLFHAPRADGAGCRVPKDDRAYFQARLYVELALALARGNGQIDLSAQSATRVGYYYGLMWESGRKIAMHDVLRPFTRGGAVTLRDPAGTIFRIHWQKVRDATEANDQLARDVWRYLKRALATVDDREFRHHFRALRGTMDDEMVKLFLKLASSDAKDIDSNFQHSSLLLSRTPSRDQVLHTTLGLTFRFVEMLNRDWDLMLVVSELGKVVEKYFWHQEDGNLRDAVQEKCFCIVVTENERPRIVEWRLDKLAGQLVGFREQTLFKRPPHVHTNHMVLMLKQDEQGVLQPVSGISYRKAGIHNRVNPIFLERKASYDGTAPDDLDDALACFKAYVHESVVRTRGNRRVTREQVWEAIAERVASRVGIHRVEARKIPLAEMRIAGDAEPESTRR